MHPLIFHMDPLAPDLLPMDDPEVLLGLPEDVVGVSTVDPDHGGFCQEVQAAPHQLLEVLDDLGPGSKGPGLELIVDLLRLLLDDLVEF